MQHHFLLLPIQLQDKGWAELFLESVLYLSIVNRRHIWNYREIFYGCNLIMISSVKNIHKGDHVSVFEEAGQELLSLLLLVDRFKPHPLLEVRILSSMLKFCNLFSKKSRSNAR